MSKPNLSLESKFENFGNVKRQIEEVNFLLEKTLSMIDEINRKTIPSTFAPKVSDCIPTPCSTVLPDSATHSVPMRGNVSTTCGGGNGCT